MRSFVIGLAGFLSILAIVFAIYTVSSSNSSKVSGNSFSSTTLSNPTLKPANVPSKISVCKESLNYASNGSPSPIQCNDGALNILAWDALATQEPTVMTLGYAPSQSQVTTAICKDANVADLDSSPQISAPLEETAYQLASLYYGWHFILNVPSIISAC